MQTKRIPLQILVGLGLASGSACGVTACLSIDPTDTFETETETTGDVGVTSTTAGTGATADTTEMTSATTEVTTGPCLGQLPTTGTGEMTDSTDGSTGSSTGDGDGDGDGDGGDGDACLDGDGSYDAQPLVGTGGDPEGEALRSALIDRVLSTSVLPEDVKSRLRARMQASGNGEPAPKDSTDRSAGT